MSTTMSNPTVPDASPAGALDSEELLSRADVRLLPVTTKEDLRRTYPFGMFAVPMAQVRRIHASSGTTGRPTVVGYTQGDLDRCVVDFTERTVCNPSTGSGAEGPDTGTERSRR